MKTALIVTHEKFQDHELIYPYYRLKGAGFDVKIVANKLGKIFGIMGTNMPCELTYSDMESESFPDLIIIPGGVKALEKLRQEMGVLKYIHDYYNAGGVIGSICHGAQLMISSKIVSGEKISGYYSIMDDINNAGATYSADPIVISDNGKIISSPHYDYMGEWMEEVIQRVIT